MRTKSGDDDNNDPEPEFGTCPSCGAVTNSKPGQQTSAHQKPGSRESCPGGTAQ